MKPAIRKIGVEERPTTAVVIIPGPSHGWILRLSARMLGGAIAAARRLVQVSPTFILSVVLVALVIVDLRLPHYLHSLSNSRQEICRANMQILAEAEQAYRRHTGRYTRNLHALLKYADLLAVPICPNRGNYRVVLGPARTRDGKRVPAGKFAIEDCGADGHGSFVP